MHHCSWGCPPIIEWAPQNGGRWVRPHLIMYKYPQEHTLQCNALESSWKVCARCSRRRNTVTHTLSRGNSSHSPWSNTSSLLSLPPSLPPPPAHAHSHASSSSVRARPKRRFQNCWSVGNMTLRLAGSDTQTQAARAQAPAGATQTRKEKNVSNASFVNSDEAESNTALILSHVYSWDYASATLVRSNWWAVQAVMVSTSLSCSHTCTECTWWQATETRRD